MYIYICLKKPLEGYIHETINGSYSGKTMSWCSQEERNIPFLCSVVLPCLIVLQQNNFSTSCAILNCKKETLQKTMKMV